MARRETPAARVRRSARLRPMLVVGGAACRRHLLDRGPPLPTTSNCNGRRRRRLRLRWEWHSEGPSCWTPSSQRCRDSLFSSSTSRPRPLSTCRALHGVLLVPRWRRRPEVVGQQRPPRSSSLLASLHRMGPSGQRPTTSRCRRSRTARASKHRQWGHPGRCRPQRNSPPALCGAPHIAAPCRSTRHAAGLQVWRTGPHQAYRSPCSSGAHLGRSLARRLPTWRVLQCAAKAAQQRPLPRHSTVWRPLPLSRPPA